jgi:hypothetical protein
MGDAMKALRKNVMVANTGPVVTRFAGYGTAANETPVAPATTPHDARARNIALFAAAPLVGLAYVVAFPIIGLAMLAWMAVRPLVKRWKPIAHFAKNVALFLAAPFVGLAYALAFPFVAIGMLAWKGTRAMVKG